MEIKKISQGQLPPANQYIAIHVPGRPWHDTDDTYGVKWKIAKCIYGISMAERKALAQSDNCFDRTRASRYFAADENGNNKKPYYFNAFGPDSYFGQEVDEWCELPGREV